MMPCPTPAALITRSKTVPSTSARAPQPCSAGSCSTYCAGSGRAPPGDKVRKLLGTKSWLEGLDLDAVQQGASLTLTPEQLAEARRLKARWDEITPANVRLGLRQKGVDMRIGLDIASITLKRQADIILLVAGDSDFVPAAKLARREGVEFILDPLWQAINADLFEHIDGLQSGLRKPKSKAAVAAIEAADAANLPPEPNEPEDD